MKREQTQVLRKSKQFLPITMLVVRTKSKLGDVYVVYTSIIGIELELLRRGSDLKSKLCTYWKISKVAR
jgi:hypothetical protein